MPGTSITSSKTQLGDYQYLFVTWAREIEDNLSVPRHMRTEGITCEIRATIFRDGRVEQIRIIRSSGNRILDDLAVRALQKASPLAPFPDTLKLDYSEEEFLVDFSPTE